MPLRSVRFIPGKKPTSRSAASDITLPQPTRRNPRRSKNRYGCSRTRQSHLSRLNIRSQASATICNPSICISVPAFDLREGMTAVRSYRPAIRWMRPSHPRSHAPSRLPATLQSRPQSSCSAFLRRLHRQLVTSQHGNIASGSPAAAALVSLAGSTLNLCSCRLAC